MENALNFKAWVGLAAIGGRRVTQNAAAFRARAQEVSYEFLGPRENESQTVNVIYDEGKVMDLWIGQGCYEEVRYRVPPARRTAMINTLKKAGLV